MDERSYWLGFSVFPGIGPKRFGLLLANFGTAKEAWEADLQELEKVIGKTFAGQFVHFRGKFNIEKYQELLGEKDVSYITLGDDSYPQLLSSVESPPFLLFVKGEKAILNLNDRFIAIVGTRRISSYGRDVTEKITADLVNAGFTTVSGLALGVDACAHQTTIEQGGKTIAVLGCGVVCCSPRDNYKLYQEIQSSGGCIISQYPLSEPPMKGSFPARNKIIAGLSLATVFTEGASDSGALYTAKFALEFGRKVFAVPGPITSQLSKGPNQLIARGAKLVAGAEDILKELMVNSEGRIVNSKKIIEGDTEEEQKIIDLLINDNLHFDEIVRKTRQDSAYIGPILTLMEMKGKIKSENNIFSLEI